jgi:hypothetical protein
VVGVAHDFDVAEAGGAFGAESLECVLGVHRVAGESSLDLPVDNHVDLDARLCSALQNLVETPFLVEVGRAPEEQLGRQPPVGDVDGFLCLLEGNRNCLLLCLMFISSEYTQKSFFRLMGRASWYAYPEIISTIHIPLHHVTVPLGEVGLEPVRLGDLAALLITGLLMRLIMAVM